MAKLPIKISVIGAGGSFTVGFVHDLCLAPNLFGSTISLMDTDADRLSDALSICTRCVAEMGAAFSFESTVSRQESLSGADFVVTTALVDGARRLSEGWAIAEKHGVKWGGSYHILYDEPFWLNYYQLKLFESITEDMLAICPDAWHLLVSNPVITATTHLYRKYAGTKLLGLCHGFGGVFEICDVLGLDREHFSYEIPGVNHFVWLNSAHYKGEDVFPMIDRWLETRAEEHWKHSPEGTMGRKKMDLYRKYGAIPIGDTASITGASWPWWYHSDEEVERAWGVDSRNWWWRYVGGLARNAADLKAKATETSGTVDTTATAVTAVSAVTLADANRPRVCQAFSLSETEQTGEPMVPIIESMVCGIPRIIVTNLPNHAEYVPGLPRDFEVEIPTLISASGAQGVHTKALPRPILAHIMRDRIAPVELELEAYNTGSIDLLLELVMTDKWIVSKAHAEALVDEIFALPYHEELRRHYR